MKHRNGWVIFDIGHLPETIGAGGFIDIYGLHSLVGAGSGGVEK